MKPGIKILQSLLYGAGPAVVNYDIWEMALTKPPHTDEEAECFCSDIITQGDGMFRGLRAH